MWIFQRVGLRRPLSQLVFAIILVFVIVTITKGSGDISHEIKIEAEYLKDKFDNAMASTDFSIEKYMNKDSGDSSSKPDEGEHTEEAKEPELAACTVINPLTNSFFDLRTLGALGGETHSWNAKGYDYGRNFSIGICSTPIKQKTQLHDTDFPDISNRTEVGAYYIDAYGVRQSIGQVSTAPKFRGRKLTLEYTDGDVCQTLENGDKLRKSTLLTFTCDRDIMSKAQINYVGSLGDCSYFFEVKTIHACATAHQEDDMALLYIFMLIVLSAFAVYSGGGLLYKLFKHIGHASHAHAPPHASSVRTHGRGKSVAQQTEVRQSVSAHGKIDVD